MIPNVAAAFHASQAQIHSADFDHILAALRGDGVVQGLDIVQDTGANMLVKTNTAGVAIIGGTVTKLAAAVTGTITAAHATLPRIDLISISNADALVVTAGTAAANPLIPATPANNLALATVYVPATDTAITTAQVTDKRYFIGKQPILIDRQMGTLGATNISTEATAYTYTVKANLLGTTRGLRLRIVGNYKPGTAAATFTIRVKFGATTMWADVTASRAILNVLGGWYMEITLFNVAATNAQRVGGFCHLGAHVATTSGTAGDLSLTVATATDVIAPFYGTAAIDSTADQAFVVTVQMSAAGALNLITREMAILELIP